MTEIRTAAATLGGKLTDLAGPELKVGEAAPDFNLQTNSLQEVTLGSYAGKTLLIATIPSLDTPICHLETIKFNEQAAKLENVQVLVVSTDLPFGQKRWCGAEGVSNVATLSAHRSSAFGEAFGVLITGGKFDQCLSRAIFVVNDAGKLTHVEYVKEVGDHPNYETALVAVGG